MSRRAAPPCIGPSPPSSTLPEAWATERARRAKVHVPTEVTFQTKPELALALVDQARAWGVPFAWWSPTLATATTRPSCRASRTARSPTWWASAAPLGCACPTEVRAPRSSPARPGAGQPKKPRPAPLYQAKAVLEALPDEPLADDHLARARRHGPPQTVRGRAGALGHGWRAVLHQPSPRQHGPEGWLLGERPVPGERGEVQWYFSNLPADTPLHRLVELAHSRWPIEQFYEDAKGECGLDHYQGRRWDGLHRHLALVMLAYSFLARQRWMPANPAGFSPSGSVRRSQRSIARCSCGSSKMSCCGSSRPTRSPISAPGGSNEVVLER